MEDVHHCSTSWNGLGLAHYVRVCRLGRAKGLAWRLTQHNGQGLDNSIIH